ncbi:polyphosphate kinase 1 [Chitinophagales bacterium]|nr:polyphosphate kinase 1 [Chitinophagales bacterium]
MSTLPENRFINRELSWLDFNARILQEAANKSVPLIERMRFLGIFSNNMDEFFSIRVATVRRMLGMGRKARKSLSTAPRELLKEIKVKVTKQQTEFEKIYLNIKAEMEQQGIYILNEQQLDEAQGKFCMEYADEFIRPKLVPIMLNYLEDFPELDELTVYLAIRLELEENEPLFALVEVPENADRFIEIPSEDDKKYIIFLDDLIRYSLKTIFRQFKVKEAKAYAIKVTRDGELDMDNDISKSLVEKISKSVKNREHGEPVRFIYDKTIDKDLLHFILEKFDLLENENNIKGGRYHNKKDYMKFPDLGKKDLVFPKLKALSHPDFSEDKTIREVVEEKDVLLHCPYQKFSYLLDFLRESAIDPQVTTIKMTMYRLAKFSAVANSLIDASKNGKKVVVLVELKARFDETSNIYWAKKMQEEGVEVIYGVPNLKVHSKMCLVSRVENGVRSRIAFFSTGNFNESTAKVYSDMTLFTANKKLTYECNKVFQFFDRNFMIYNYKHLMVSPHSTRSGFEKLIDHEIAFAKAGKEAFIFAKLNSLADQGMVDKLYAASQAGVRVQLIVRGICILIPQVKGLSENIEVISIVDKYLEHSRVFIFGNNGDEKVFLSSADWMQRNLDFRVELTFPILSKKIKKLVIDFMNLQWSDNTKARWNSGENANRYRKTNSEVPVRAQVDLYKMLQEQQ